MPGKNKIVGNFKVTCPHQIFSTIKAKNGKRVKTTNDFKKSENVEKLVLDDCQTLSGASFTILTVVYFCFFTS